MTHAPISVTVLLLLAPIAAGAESSRESFGVVRVDAPRALERAALDALARVAARRWVVVSQGEILLRVARDPGIRAGIEQARRSLVDAELALADLDRHRASLAVKRGRAALEATAGRVHSPALLAQLHLALARVNLLVPIDPVAAQHAVEAAVEADPELTADLRVMPPRIVAMIETTRKRQRSVAPPTPEELALLARASGVDVIAWLGIEATTPRAMLSLRVHSRRGVRMHGEEVAIRELETCFSRWLLEPSFVRVAAPRVPVAPRDQRRWYQRWWVWTIVGAAAAGAVGASLGVALHRRSYDLHVSF